MSLRMSHLRTGTFNCQRFSLVVKPCSCTGSGKSGSHACLQLLGPKPCGLLQGQALREVEQQTLKSCDRDRGGCGRDQQVRFFLEGTPPAALTLQLAWERQQESAADIRDTMATIHEVLLSTCSALPALPLLLCYSKNESSAYGHSDLPAVLTSGEAQ